MGWGQPDSTREGGESRWREAERGRFLKSLLCKVMRACRQNTYGKFKSYMIKTHMEYSSDYSSNWLNMDDLT